jgi:deoxyribodipyrimidine photo-lyase
MTRDPRPTLLWLRRDLRLADNPALAAAASTGSPVIPIFIDDAPRLGGAARWWRGRSLAALSDAFARLGSRLIIRQGDALDQIMSLVQETGAGSVYFNRRFEPRGLTTDAQVVTELRGAGIEVLEHQGNRLHEPWNLKTLKGEPFRVFTPFWRRLAENYHAPARCAAPTALTRPRAWPASIEISTLQVGAPWSAGMTTQWRPGEAGGLALLERLPAKVPDYGALRDRPDVEGTSRLSPHLAWGEVSVHEIWRRLAADGPPASNAFLRELGWRDFNTHLLYHFPRLPVQNWNPRFDSFPFRQAPDDFKSWCKGRTGFPIVDAGMRELWTTGWMHNRVRMIVASFLIKDLLIDWRDGEKWFWDTLVDADLAQNAGNWQWVAGSGADAAPYFRVFNPTTQSAKFDPDGTYIRRWIPELARLPLTFIHEPATAPDDMLLNAGIELGRTYPHPIVDHAAARGRALAIYKTLGSVAQDDVDDAESKHKAGSKQRTLFS